MGNVVLNWPVIERALWKGKLDLRIWGSYESGDSQGGSASQTIDNIRQQCAESQKKACPRLPERIINQF